MKKLIFAAASALTIALAVPMVALAHGHRGGEDHMSKVDTNGDGIVTRAEAETSATAMFAAMDANKDGFLTQVEMKAHRDAQREEMKAKWAEKNEGKEMKPRGDRDPAKIEARKAKMEEKGAERFAAIDTDSDGRLSTVEFTAQHLEHFNKVDTNGDGSISAEEHEAARATMKEHRGKWRDKPAEQ